MIKIMLYRLALILCAIAINCQILPAQTPSSQDLIKEGNARYEHADYEAAITEYRKITPTAGAAYAQALYNIGVCYYELNRTDAAIAMYRASIAARPDYAQAFYALGVALEDTGTRLEAKAAYQRALAVSRGQLPAAAHKLGVLLASAGDYDAAAKLFKQAIEQSHDKLPASHNNLGVMLAQNGRLAEAARQFEIALAQTEGSFADASHNLKLCRLLLNTRTSDSLAAMRLVTDESAQQIKRGKD